MNDSPALVIFDLDGTLVDPAGSITGGIAHALTAHGLPVPDQASLSSMVGPPLVESLARLGSVPAEEVPGVVHTYRRHYVTAGMAESRPYPGVPELLARLRARGLRLAVATQKPQTLAERLLEVHGLDACFDSVHGAPDDETQPPAADGKAGMVRAALEENRAAAGSSVMVGDRRYDAAGAEANSVPCIGVRWGFAPAGELEALALVALVEDADELESAVIAVLAGAVAEAAPC
ncbi:HAD hydrolase-like protein [Sinomonas halotolerans]|uniref:HAD hydrolase-like protein n=1 Tax=Sinomonas halotolerans TaxID=1644133 RepID=A0ABU9X168_9MICC